MNAFADAAPDYLGLGWQPVPLHVPTARGCSCPQAVDCASPGKHPRTAWPKGQRIDSA